MTNGWGRNDAREVENDGGAAIKQLRWRCRRGTRELDMLLLGFLERDYPQLNTEQQALFGMLLDEADPDLYAWITGKEQPINPDYLTIIGRINET